MNFNTRCLSTKQSPHYDKVMSLTNPKPINFNMIGPSQCWYWLPPTSRILFSIQAIQVKGVKNLIYTFTDNFLLQKTAPEPYSGKTKVFVSHPSSKR
jgi:hypothetical protein